MTPPTVKTRLVQMEVLPGHPSRNTDVILDHINTARSDGVDIVAFPEMCVPGYLIGDEWEFHAFLRECETCAEKLRNASAGIVVIFGSVAVDWDRRNEDGRVRKFNALFVADNGSFVGPEPSPYPFVIKTLMPNYREFDDSRHFFDLRKLAMETGKSVSELTSPVKTSRGTLGCVICEDAWNMDYAYAPLEKLSRSDIDLYINISSSPYTFNKNNKRTRVFLDWVHKLERPILFVNNVGIQNNGKTVFTFDGSSCIYDATGHVMKSEPGFEPSVLTADLNSVTGKIFDQPATPHDDTIADLYAAIKYGTKEFMKLCGVSKVTVGVSGGIDSAVVAALYADILNPNDLLLVNMPGPYTSQTTRNLADQLISNIGCYHASLPIADSVSLTKSQVSGLSISRGDGREARTLELSNFLLENVQARDRSSRVLAAIASAFGGVFTCNANKSEMTVGYSTLYGDLCGYLASVADLWKMEVYELARYMNNSVFGSELIPQGCIDLTPSAELSEAQDVDKGQGDPLIYPYHDRLFSSWVERWNRAAPEDILTWYSEGRLEEELGYTGKISDLFPDTKSFIADLERWWRLYKGMGLAKRIQAPPVLAVKRRSFGFDHRESQMGALTTQSYEALKEQLLN